MNVSFCCHQFVPASAFRILRRWGTICFTISTCCEKKKWVSNFTLRSLKSRSSGSGKLSTVTAGWRCDWWVPDVKSVTSDIGAETLRPLSSAQSLADSAWAARVSATSCWVCRWLYCVYFICIWGMELDVMGVISLPYVNSRTKITTTFFRHNSVSILSV